MPSRKRGARPLLFPQRGRRRGGEGRFCGKRLGRRCRRSAPFPPAASPLRAIDRRSWAGSSGETPTPRGAGSAGTPPRHPLPSLLSTPSAPSLPPPARPNRRGPVSLSLSRPSAKPAKKILETRYFPFCTKGGKNLLYFSGRWIDNRYCPYTPAVIQYMVLWPASGFLRGGKAPDRRKRREAKCQFQRMQRPSWSGGI